MKSPEKISTEIFQDIRSRFSPVRMGDISAQTTVDPEKAAFFNFTYRENNREYGPITIALADRASFKIFYTTDMVKKLGNSEEWYGFLRRMRKLAVRNLLSFDARDIGKNQLDPRDFEFISANDSPYEENEEIRESRNMYGTNRKSYQTIGENTKLIVNHSESIDPEVRGARSRKINSLFIERADGERYRVPFNYLNGARSLAFHVDQGGTPYDSVGNHIVEMVNEMNDLKRFGRLTRRVATENEDAAGFRNQVVECFEEMRSSLSRLQQPAFYASYVSEFENLNTDNSLVEMEEDGMKDTLTRQVRSEDIDQLLPVVTQILSNHRNIKEQRLARKLEEDSSAVSNAIASPDFVLMLRADEKADRAFLRMQFQTAEALIGYSMSDIAARIVGKNSDEISNWASQTSDRVGEDGYRKLSDSERQLAMRLTKHYMSDMKKIHSEPEYANKVRKDLSNSGTRIHYEMKEEREIEEILNRLSEVNDMLESTVGTTGTVGTANTPVTPRKTNQQAVKAMSGNDPNKARDIKRVSDKLARKQHLTPQEEEIANSIATQTMTSEALGTSHEYETNPAMDAVIYRLNRTGKMTELLTQYGLDRVEDEIRNVTDYLDDLEEIGSSDVSTWVREVLQGFGENNNSESDLDTMKRLSGI